MSEESEGKVMYAAKLFNDILEIKEVSEGVVRRIGTEGLSNTKFEAAEALKERIMKQFLHDMKCVDWQAQQFIKTL